MGIVELKRNAINKYASANNDETRQQVLAEVAKELEEFGQSTEEIRKIRHEIIVEAQSNYRTMQNTQKAQNIINKHKGGQK